MNINPIIPSVAAVGFLIWAIVMTVLYTQKAPESAAPAATTTASSEATSSLLTQKASFGTENLCAGAKIKADNVPCMEDMLEDSANVTEGATAVAYTTAAVGVGPQAGANVTAGYKGSMDVGDLMPITEPYYKKGLCPVNVHWHLGAEHYSAGEFDCTENMHDDERRLAQKCGPSDIHERRLAAGKERQGFQCNYYDETDAKFTTPYEWKFCDQSMEVGQTYESKYFSYEPSVYYLN